MVAVNSGYGIMEEITRARTHLSVILVDYGYSAYSESKEHLQQAAELGLVEMVQLSGDESEEKVYCMAGCCTS